MRADALQAAVFSALAGDAALVASLSQSWGVPAIFSDVPQENADDGAFYPFVSLGPDATTAWNTKEETGSQSTLTVNVWSRSGDWLEVKAIAGAVRAILDRADLMAGVVLFDFAAAEFWMDPDGETRRGMLTFRTLYI